MLEPQAIHWIPPVCKDEISFDLHLLYLEHCFAAQDRPGSKRGAVGPEIAPGLVKMCDGTCEIDGSLQVSELFGQSLKTD